MSNKSPNNWVRCKLGDVCFLSNGDKVFSVSLPLLNVRYLRGKKVVEIKESGVLVKKNDHVILVDGENSGEVFLVKEQGILGSTLKKLSFYHEKTEKYVLHIIQFYQKLFKESKKGSAIPHLDKKLFKEISIAIPPLPEQERIVAKIEELFSKIDISVKQLEQAKEQIRQSCQSIFKVAFSGKLYKTTEWKLITLNDVCEKIIGGGTPSRQVSKYYAGTIPFMTVKDMISNRPKGTQWHITREALNNSSTNLIPKDTIIIATRVGLGKILRANFDTAINQDLKAIFPKKNIKKDFFELLLLGLVPEIEKLGRGTTVKGISLNDLKGIKILLPSFPEQTRIISIIKAFLKRTGIIEKAVDVSLEKASRLKQAILKQAFSGKLVPQNPDDEPAEVLLAKIKAEKEKFARK